MTEKQYQGYLIRKKEKEEFDREQKARAEIIHRSLDSLPLLPSDDQGDIYGSSEEFVGETESFLVLAA